MNVFAKPFTSSQSGRFDGVSESSSPAATGGAVTIGVSVAIGATVSKAGAGGGERRLMEMRRRVDDLKPLSTSDVGSGVAVITGAGSAVLVGLILVSVGVGMGTGCTLLVSSGDVVSRVVVWPLFVLDIVT